jgi:hypothetical protein
MNRKSLQSVDPTDGGHAGRARRRSTERDLRPTARPPHRFLAAVVAVHATLAFSCNHPDPKTALDVFRALHLPDGTTVINQSWGDSTSHVSVEVGVEAPLQLDDIGFPEGVRPSPASSSLGQTGRCDYDSGDPLAKPPTPMCAYTIVADHRVDDPSHPRDDCTIYGEQWSDTIIRDSRQLFRARFIVKCRMQRPAAG